MSALGADAFELIGEKLGEAFAGLGQMGDGVVDAQLSPVDSYRGSYSNVVGLPVGLLARLMRETGGIDPENASRLIRSEAP